jgi:hypothetical protein
MSFLSAYEGITRVKVGPSGLDYYIDVREHISYQEREAAEKALSDMKIEGSTVTPAPDVMKYRQLLVLAHVKEWNIDDEDGSVWPIDAAHIGKLPGEVFDELWTLIDGKSKSRDKAEQRRFPDGVDVSDQVRKPRTRKLAEVPA